MIHCLIFSGDRMKGQCLREAFHSILQLEESDISFILHHSLLTAFIFKVQRTVIKIIKMIHRRFFFLASR